MAALPVGCNVRLLVFLLLTHMEHFGSTYAITSTGKVSISRGHLPRRRPHTFYCTSQVRTMQIPERRPVKF
jgi:hypothetical protein